MKDFEKISPKEVLIELANGSDIFAFVLKLDSRRAVTYTSYRLREERVGAIQKITDQDNVVFYKKKEEVTV